MAGKKFSLTEKTGNYGNSLFKNRLKEKATLSVQTAAIAAEKLARENGATHIGREHFLCAILQVAAQSPDAEESKNFSVLLALCNLKQEEILIYAQAAIEKVGEPTAGELTLSTDAGLAMVYADIEADDIRALRIGLEHVFLALITPQLSSHLDKTLEPLQLNVREIRRRLHSINSAQKSEPRLTEGMKKTLDCAEATMRSTFCGRISPLHLLLGILGNPNNRAYELLATANVNLDALKEKAKREITSDHEIAASQKRYSKGAQRALYRAERIAKEASYRHTAPEHLLLALLPQKVSLGQKWAEKRKFGEVEELDDFWSGTDVEAIRTLINRDFFGTNRFIPEKRSKWTPILEFYLPLTVSWALMYFGRRSGADGASLVVVGGTVLVTTSSFFLIGMIFFSRSHKLKRMSIIIFASILLGIILGGFTAPKG